MQNENAHPGLNRVGADRGKLRQTTPLVYSKSASETTETFLTRLEHVRETGPGCWVARCPSHEDKNPSLSIKACADGTLLIHCFAGCGAADVVAAIGLELRDLFPPADRHRGRPKSDFERRRYGQAAAALKALARESAIVLLAAEQLTAGNALTPGDLERLRLAAHRIEAAREIAK